MFFSFLLAQKWQFNGSYNFSLLQLKQKHLLPASLFNLIYLSISVGGIDVTVTLSVLVQIDVMANSVGTDQTDPKGLV